jgi:hypothetical protein
MKSLVLLSAVALSLLQAHAASPSAPTRDDAWIDQRVLQLQPRAKEKRFDEIGWARDIRSAIKLAAEHQRPVFLFTHDGRMNIGRC